MILQILPEMQFQAPLSNALPRACQGGLWTPTRINLNQRIEHECNQIATGK